MNPEHDEELAEWLYRYRSYQQRLDAWKQLRAEEPDTAAAFLIDARRLRMFINSLP